MSALSSKLEAVLLDLLSDAARKAASLSEMRRASRDKARIAAAEQLQEHIASALTTLETGGAT